MTSNKIHDDHALSGKPLAISLCEGMQFVDVQIYLKITPQDRIKIRQSRVNHNGNLFSTHLRAVLM